MISIKNDVFLVNNFTNRIISTSRDYKLPIESEECTVGMSIDSRCNESYSYGVNIIENYSMNLLKLSNILTNISNSFSSNDNDISIRIRR